MSDEQLEEYTARLKRAHATLLELAAGYSDGRNPEGWRLTGKAEGISLALDYLRSYQ